MYEGLNIKELELLGSGTQGQVYRIDSQRCIKIFKRKRACRDEAQTLTMAQTDPHFPRLYEYGENYIIRECINGIQLSKYLSSNPITPEISYKIIELYEAMVEIGYNRLDTALFHIFLTPSGDLKIIDTAKAMRKKTIYPYLIISGLEKLGYKNQFLEFVNSERPELYKKWIQYSN